MDHKSLMVSLLFLVAIAEASYGTSITRDVYTLTASLDVEPFVTGANSNPRNWIRFSNSSVSIYEEPSTIPASAVETTEQTVGSPGTGLFNRFLNPAINHVQNTEQTIGSPGSILSNRFLDSPINHVQNTEQTIGSSGSILSNRFLDSPINHVQNTEQTIGSSGSILSNRFINPAINHVQNTEQTIGTSGSILSNRFINPAINHVQNTEQTIGSSGSILSNRFINPAINNIQNTEQTIGTSGSILSNRFINPAINNIQNTEQTIRPPKTILSSRYPNPPINHLQTTEQTLGSSETVLSSSFLPAPPNRAKVDPESSSSSEDDDPEGPPDHVIPHSSHEEPREVPTRPKYNAPGEWAKPPADKDIPLDFVPTKLYAQVRTTHTVKRVPREEALEAAQTEEERENALRLREVVTNSKVNTVYTEEGYEDSAYDHAGHIRDADFHEGFARKQHDQLDRKRVSGDGQRRKKRKKNREKGRFRVNPEKFEEYEDDYRDHYEDRPSEKTHADDQEDDEWQPTADDPKYIVEHGVQKLEEDVEREEEEAEADSEINRTLDLHNATNDEHEDEESIQESHKIRENQTVQPIEKKKKKKTKKLNYSPEHYNDNYEPSSSFRDTIEGSKEKDNDKVYPEDDPEDFRITEIPPLRKTTHENSRLEETREQEDSESYLENPSESSRFNPPRISSRYRTPMPASTSSSRPASSEESTTVSYSELLWNFYKAKQKQPKTTVQSPLIPEPTTSNPSVEQQTAVAVATINGHGPYLLLTKQETPETTIQPSFVSSEASYAQKFYSEPDSTSQTSFTDFLNPGNRVGYMENINNLLSSSTMAALSDFSSTLDQFNAFWQPLTTQQTVFPETTQASERSLDVLASSSEASPVVSPLRADEVEEIREEARFDVSGEYKEDSLNPEVQSVNSTGSRKPRYKILVRNKPKKSGHVPQGRESSSNRDGSSMENRQNGVPSFKEIEVNANYMKVLNYLRGKDSIYGDAKKQGKDFGSDVERNYPEDLTIMKPPRPSRISYPDFSSNLQPGESILLDRSSVRIEGEIPRGAKWKSKSKASSRNRYEHSRPIAVTGNPVYPTDFFRIPTVYTGTYLPIVSSPAKSVSSERRLTPRKLIFPEARGISSKTKLIPSATKAISSGEKAVLAKNKVPVQETKLAGPTYSLEDEYIRREVDNYARQQDFDPDRYENIQRIKDYVDVQNEDYPRRQKVEQMKYKEGDYAGGNDGQNQKHDYIRHRNLALPHTDYIRHQNVDQIMDQAVPQNIDQTRYIDQPRYQDNTYIHHGNENRARNQEKDYLHRQNLAIKNDHRTNPRVNQARYENIDQDRHPSIDQIQHQKVNHPKPSNGKYLNDQDAYIGYPKDARAKHREEIYSRHPDEYHMNHDNSNFKYTNQNYPRYESNDEIIHQIPRGDDQFGHQASPNRQFLHQVASNNEHIEQRLLLRGNDRFRHHVPRVEDQLGQQAVSFGNKVVDSLIQGYSQIEAVGRRRRRSVDGISDVKGFYPSTGRRNRAELEHGDREDEEKEAALCKARSSEIARRLEAPGRRDGEERKREEQKGISMITDASSNGNPGNFKNGEKRKTVRKWQKGKFTMKLGIGNKSKDENGAQKGEDKKPTGFQIIDKTKKRTVLTKNTKHGRNDINHSKIDAQKENPLKKNSSITVNSLKLKKKQTGMSIQKLSKPVFLSRRKRGTPKDHNDLLNEAPKISSAMIDKEIESRFNEKQDENEAKKINKEEEIEVEIPEFDYVEELVEEEHPKIVTTTEATLDPSKYPFYRSQKIPSLSPLKYITDPRRVPRKTAGGMEFYDSRDAYKECADVEPNLEEVVPEEEEPVNDRGPKENLPRLRGLGDKLDCFKAKYFDESPFDSPLFLEKQVEEATPPSELNPKDFVSRILHLPRENDDYVVQKSFRTPEHSRLPPGKRDSKDLKRLQEKNEAIRAKHEQNPGTEEDRRNLRATRKLRLKKPGDSREGRSRGRRIPVEKQILDPAPYQSQVYEDVMGNIKNLAHSYQGANTKNLVNSYQGANTKNLVNSYQGANTKNLANSYHGAHTKNLANSYHGANTKNLANSYQVREVSTVQPFTQILATAANEDFRSVTSATKQGFKRDRDTGVPLVDITESPGLNNFLDIEGLLPPKDSARFSTGYATSRGFGNKKSKKPPNPLRVTGHYQKIRLQRRSLDGKQDVFGSNERGLRTKQEGRDPIAEANKERLEDKRVQWPIFNTTFPPANLLVEQNGTKPRDQEALPVASKRENARRRLQNAAQNTSITIENNLQDDQKEATTQRVIYTIRDRIRYSRPKEVATGFGKFTGSTTIIEEDSRRKEPTYNYVKRKKHAGTLPPNSTNLFNTSSESTNTILLANVSDATMAKSDGKPNDTVNELHPESTQKIQYSTQSLVDLNLDSKTRSNGYEDNEKDGKEDSSPPITEKSIKGYDVYEKINENINTTTLPPLISITPSQFSGLKAYLESDPPGYAETFPEEFEKSPTSHATNQSKGVDFNEEYKPKEDRKVINKENKEEKNYEPYTSKESFPEKAEIEEDPRNNRNEEKQEEEEEEEEEEDTSKEEKDSKQDFTFSSRPSSPAESFEDEKYSDLGPRINKPAFHHPPFPIEKYEGSGKATYREGAEKEIEERKQEEEEDEDEKEDYVFPWQRDKDQEKRGSLKLRSEPLGRYEFPWERRERLDKELRRKQREKYKRLKEIFGEDEDSEEEGTALHGERYVYPWEKYDVPTKRHVSSRHGARRDQNSEEIATEVRPLKIVKFSSRYNSGYKLPKSQAKKSSAGDISRSIRKILEDDWRNESSASSEEYVEPLPFGSKASARSEKTRGISRGMIVPEDVTLAPVKRTRKKSPRGSVKSEVTTVKSTKNNGGIDEVLKQSSRMKESNREKPKLRIKVVEAIPEVIADLAKTNSTKEPPRKRGRRPSKKLVPKEEESPVEPIAASSQRNRRRQRVQSTTEAAITSTTSPTTSTTTSGSRSSRRRHQRVSGSDVKSDGDSSSQNTTKTPSSRASRVDRAEEDSKARSRSTEHRSKLAKEVPRTTYPEQTAVKSTSERSSGRRRSKAAKGESKKEESSASRSKDVERKLEEKARGRTKEEEIEEEEEEPLNEPMENAKAHRDKHFPRFTRFEEEEDEGDEEDSGDELSTEVSLAPQSRVFELIEHGTRKIFSSVSWILENDRF
ncbi:hypothetical protein KM043_014804 [Ampulex compressa]|nr:hypothetical protein KM043_014804 [Ampulex compressa]